MSDQQQAYRIVELDRPTFECWVCGEETFGGYGLTVYESQILPNDWKGEWGGTTVCERCYGLFNHDTGEPISWTVANAMLREVGDKNLERLLEKQGQEIFEANDREDRAMDKPWIDAHCHSCDWDGYTDEMDGPCPGCGEYESVRENHIEAETQTPNI